MELFELENLLGLRGDSACLMGGIIYSRYFVNN